MVKINCSGKMRITSVRRFEPTRLASWLFILFLSLANLPAHAADWSIVPQVDLGAKYDSNINFNFIGRQHDFIYDTAPSVDFNYASEATKLTGHVGLDGQVYVNHSNLDTINQYYRFSGQQQVPPALL